MKKTIWKYPLDLGPGLLFDGQDPTRPVFEMPVGAEVLTLQTQHGAPTLWVLVEPEAAVEDREFVIVGTGHDVPDEAGEYVGTWQAQGGVFVFHLFEVAR